MRVSLPILLFASVYSAENLRESVPTANKDETRFLTGTALFGYDSQPASLQCNAIGQDCSNQICQTVSDSCAVAGPQGTAGSNGPGGQTGPTGRNGNDGVDGKDGRDGAAGARGPTGPAGARGARGARGATGATGLPGADGGVGLRGPTGPQGPAGSDGAPGPKGPTGGRGPSGAAGRDGRDAPDLGVVCMKVSSDGGSGGGSGGGDGGAAGGGSGGILLTPCQKGFAIGATATCGAGYQLTGCVGYSTTQRAAISSTCKMNGNSCVCGGCLVGGHGNDIFLQAQVSCCAVQKDDESIAVDAIIKQIQPAKLCERKMFAERKRFTREGKPI